MLSGNHQEIEVTSNVEGVDVYRGEEYLGRTPLAVQVPRSSKEPLIFRKNGFRTVKAPIRTKINPNVWWNLPFTILGTTGVSTDYGSGAFYQISPSKILVKMKHLDFKSRQDSDTEEMEIFEIFGAQNFSNEKARHQSGVWSETLNQLQSSQEEP